MPLFSKGDRITQGYGLAQTSPKWLKFYQDKGYPYGHAGLDLVPLTPGDKTIHAIRDGVVFIDNDAIEGKETRDFGISVCIKSGESLVIRYGHMESNCVKVGQVIKKGDPIGVMGHTGTAANMSDHVHLEAFRVDAYGNIVSKNNGFRGRIDVRPYYSGAIG